MKFLLLLLCLCALTTATIFSTRRPVTRGWTLRTRPVVQGRTRTATRRAPLPRAEPWCKCNRSPCPCEKKVRPKLRPNIHMVKTSGTIS